MDRNFHNPSKSLILFCMFCISFLSILSAFVFFYPELTDNTIYSLSIPATLIITVFFAVIFTTIAYKIDYEYEWDPIVTSGLSALCAALIMLFMMYYFQPEITVSCDDYRPSITRLSDSLAVQYAPQEINRLASSIDMCHSIQKKRLIQRFRNLVTVFPQESTRNNLSAHLDDIEEDDVDFSDKIDQFVTAYLNELNRAVDAGRDLVRISPPELAIIKPTVTPFPTETPLPTETPSPTATLQFSQTERNIISMFISQLNDIEANELSLANGISQLISNLSVASTYDQAADILPPFYRQHLSDTNTIEVLDKIISDDFDVDGLELAFGIIIADLRRHEQVNNTPPSGEVIAPSIRDILSGAILDLGTNELTLELSELLNIVTIQRQTIYDELLYIGRTLLSDSTESLFIDYVGNARSTSELDIEEQYVILLVSILQDNKPTPSPTPTLTPIPPTPPPPCLITAEDSRVSIRAEPRQGGALLYELLQGNYVVGLERINSGSEGNWWRIESKIVNENNQPIPLYVTANLNHVTESVGCERVE